MRDLSPLFERPIAHRGLHNASEGVIENTPSAIQHAVEGRFAIEVDLQQTLDNQALVFHDDNLDRLSHSTSAVRAQTMQQLKTIQMRDTADPMWALPDLLDLVGGKVPLIIELKSLFQKGAQKEFIAGVCTSLRDYKGPVALKSFDPNMVHALKELAPDIPRGAVSCTHLGDPERHHYSRFQMLLMRFMLHMISAQPDFISYSIRDLPALGPTLFKKLKGTPIMAWTVRTPEEREKAARLADQMVFEGFNPDAVQD